MAIADYDRPFPPHSPPPERRAETPLPPGGSAGRASWQGALLAVAAVVAAGALIARWLR